MQTHQGEKCDYDARPQMLSNHYNNDYNVYLIILLNAHNQNSAW